MSLWTQMYEYFCLYMLLMLYLRTYVSSFSTFMDFFQVENEKFSCSDSLLLLLIGGWANDMFSQEQGRCSNRGLFHPNNKEKNKRRQLASRPCLRIVKNEKWNILVSNYFFVEVAALAAGAVALIPSFFITEEVTSLLSVSLMNTPACCEAFLSTM